MYTNNREAYRQAFATVWQKHLKKMPLEAIESEMLAVLLLHPEYQHLLTQAQQLTQEFIPEENPFIHLSLHMAVREQVRMDRPCGIKNIYEKLLLSYEQAHDVEHLIMSKLAGIIWSGQQAGKEPDEKKYLKALNELH